MSFQPDASHARPRLGRPREFDMDQALDSALLVFRERGYSAASLAELGAAMELTAGSIYKAFSDKRALFLAAFDRYTELRGTQLRRALDAEVHGYAKLAALLRFYAEASHGAEGRRGCLVAGSAAELATFDTDMKHRVTSALDRLEDTLRALLRTGQDDGSVSSDLDVEAAARTMLAVLQGFRILGKTGRTRTEMIAAADQALRMLR
jgi:AcrR family transcriptional regulator